MKTHALREGRLVKEHRGIVKRRPARGILAFGRDAGLLAGAGYERRDTVLVDLFPHTPRVELVSRFDRIAS